jgi:hypothetical protein
VKHVHEELVRSKLDDWAREATGLGLQAELRRSAPRGRRPAVLDAVRGWLRLAPR